MMDKQNVTILGVGLVGSLAAVYISQNGYQVQVFEKRPDPRKYMIDGGRSINLALSHRGLAALEKVGIIDQITEICLPMKGRMIHGINGELNLQPYGKEGQFINSISRSQLNLLLMEAAESHGALLKFDHECLDVEMEECIVRLEGPDGNLEVSSQFVLGADGAFSAVREVMRKTDQFNFSQYYLPHGYKELNIPPSSDGEFALDPSALHIWPREQFMLIALPNLDRSFTCTLFLPFHGKESFENLSSKASVSDFFEKWFADAVPLMPDLLVDYFDNPTSSMVTIKCNPWQRGKVGLIGDASHAIVPFYGQGMNAGFEDCRLFDEILREHNGDFESAFDNFQQGRIADTNAIAKLAFQNFIEMRDLVADPDFVLRKKIEARIHELYPESWVPLYSMVTFSHMPYAEALRIGKIQQSIMDDVMKLPDLETSWEAMDFAPLVKELKSQTL